MKANELMFGDWVMFSDLKGDGLTEAQILPPKMIRFSFELVYTWVLSKFNGTLQNCVERMSPIPLTPEILERNGWEQRDDDAKFFPGTWVGSLLLRKEERGFHILAVSDYDDEDTNDTPFIIRYVHELQHAMRLGGIEKEIKL